MSLRQSEYLMTLSSGQTLEISIDKTDEKPLGIIHILHGVAEHKNRYDVLAEYLCKRGFHVIRHNHRGHGINIDASTRGHFNNIDDLVLDVKEIRDTIKGELNEHLPYILIGHSMGSLVARKYVHDYTEDIDILILTGTVVYSNLKANLTQFALKILNTILGSHTKSKIVNRTAFKTMDKAHKSLNKDNKWLSESTENREAYKKDPYTGFAVSNKVFLEIVRTAKKANTLRFVRKQNKNMPILLISGKDDHFGGFGEGIRRLASLYKSGGSRHVTVQLYKEKRHEILFEENKYAVYEHLYKWLISQIKQIKAKDSRDE